MVNSSDLNGVISTANDLEKGEVFEAVEDEYLEDGEIYDASQERDLEKRGETYETQEPELLEPLLTTIEARHSELAAASKPLILTEKIIVSIVIVIIVLVEAYFVGRNLSRSQDFHKSGNSIDNIVSDPAHLSIEWGPEVHENPVDNMNMGHDDENLSTPELVEDFSGVGSEVFTARNGFMTNVVKIPDTSQSVIKEAEAEAISTERATPVMVEGISPTSDMD